MYKKIKNRTFEILQVAADGDVASHVADIFIISLIIINTVMVVADTFDVPAELRSVMRVVEVVSVVIFTVEYLLRLWTSDLLRPQMSPVRARLRYAVSFMALIDLFAILPFYIPFLIPIDLRVLRTLRIVRILRLFKVNRYTNALSTIGKVFRDKAGQLISSMLIERT